MATRAELLRLADEAAQDAVDWDRRAAQAREQERTLRDLAAKMGTDEVLHKREQSGNVSGVTRKHHALAIARTAAGDDPFRRHITERRFSQNKLAKKVGCSVAALSRYRKNRPIPLTIANRIEAATGWPADAEHWPGGLV